MFRGAYVMRRGTRQLSGGRSAGMDLSKIVLGFLLTCLQTGWCRTACKISPPETEVDRLKRDLLCGYDRSIKPTTSNGEPTTVELYLVLRRFTLMENHETVAVYYGIALVWKDDRLLWETSDYGNVRRIYVNSSSIWTPQIGWITMDRDDDRLYMGMIPCLVEFDKVMCISWSSFHTSCLSDFTHWPYDSQVCEAVLAPWVLQRREVGLMPINRNIIFPQVYQPNPQWAVLKAEVSDRREMFENTTFANTELTLTLTLQRHSAIYEAAAVIPAAVLVLLTLVSSWIEAECPTRQILLCTLVVCHFLYLEFISLHFRRDGSSCPLILFFYRDSMLVCGLSLVVTVLVRRMSCTSAAPPTWMSEIVIKLQSRLPGQFLLSFQHSQQVADTEAAETSSKMVSNWSLIGRLLDAINFITMSVIYFILLIAYYLYYL